MWRIRESGFVELELSLCVCVAGVSGGGGRRDDMRAVL